MLDMPISGLDLAVGIVLLVSAGLAFLRGFVHEILSIAAWVGAVAASILWLPLAQPAARKIIPIGWAADAAAGVIIFLVVLFVLSVGTHAVARAIQKTALNNVDRSLGFIFGLLRAVVILAVGLIIVDWVFSNERPKWVREAKTVPIIDATADVLKRLVPEEFMSPGEAVKNGARRLDQVIDAKKTLDRLNQPLPAGENGPAKPGEGGYQDKERQLMERLLDAADPKTDSKPAPEEKQ